MIAAPASSSRLASAPLPRTMSAAIISGPRQIELRETEIPRSAPDQLLVRLEGCGVCASNLPPWEGRPWFSYPMPPGALGHEGWGIVESLGEKVAGFAIGDRVAILSQHAYAEFDVCEMSAAVKLPLGLDGLPFPGEPLGCALNIFKRAAINGGDNVGIVGVGFLGALLTQLAVATGAKVIALSRREFALGFARRAGAAHSLRIDEPARTIEEVKQLTGGKFCDVVIEATGKQAPLDLAAELTRERGRLVIAGYHQDGPREINLQLWNWRGLDVINAHERDPAIYRDGMRRAIDAVQSGLLDPAPLYTHRFPLSRLRDALEATAARPDGFMKALVMMS